MSGTELSRVRTEFRLRLPEPINKSPLESRRSRHCYAIKCGLRVIRPATGIQVRWPFYGLIFADIFRTSMTRKAMHTWFFPVLSLAVGLGHMLWFDFGFLPFMRLLMGPPDTNSFLAWGIPALLAGLFGFFRAKPKEIWSYALLMWMPRATRFGTDWMIHPGAWLRGLHS